jgi:hypothetical protein
VWLLKTLFIRAEAWQVVGAIHHQLPEADPDERPQECPHHAVWSSRDGASRAGGRNRAAAQVVPEGLGPCNFSKTFHGLDRVLQADELAASEPVEQLDELVPDEHPLGDRLERVQPATDRAGGRHAPDMQVATHTAMAAHAAETMDVTDPSSAIPTMAAR